MEKQLLERSLHCLEQPGGVILVPTETVYGLVCDWHDNVARERIYRLKHRSENKPLAMFADSAEMAERFGVQLNDDARKLLNKFSPGPITVIAPGSGDYPTVGVRIPDHDFILQLLRKRRRPLASTSANASGMPNVLSVAEALTQLDGKVDMAVDGGTLQENALASTVVSVCSGTVQILRQGPVSELDIRRELHQ